MAPATDAENALIELLIRRAHRMSTTIIILGVALVLALVVNGILVGMVSDLTHTAKVNANNRRTFQCHMERIHGLPEVDCDR